MNEYNIKLQSDDRTMILKMKAHSTGELLVILSGRPADIRWATKIEITDIEKWPQETK